VTIPANPQVAITGDTRLCPTESSTLSATAGFVNYTWNNNSKQAQLEVNQSGTYSVTITDINGCTATDNIIVEALPAPALAITGPDVVCNNTDINLNAGAGFAKYEWNNSSNQQQISTNQPGTYTVTVSNADGCTASAEKTVQPGGVFNPLITVLPYQCDQQITMFATGEIVTYKWSNGGGLSAITVQQPGTYTVTATNTAGCSGTASVLVTIPALPVVDITGDARLCPGESSTLSATAGFVNYTWNNNGNQAQLTVNQAGTYSVTIADANGCTATDNIIVSAAPVPATQISGPAVICGNNTVTLDAGIGFSTYTWSNAGNQQQISTNQPAPTPSRSAMPTAAQPPMSSS
jgi:hypothetical protein